MSQNVMFVEGIGNLVVTGNLVRIEFAQMQGIKDGKPQFAPGPQVVMPLEGFLQSLEIQRQAAAKLLKDGVLKQTPPSDATATTKDGSKTGQA